jgi:hypothetical protein
MAECELCGKSASDPHALGLSCPQEACPMRAPITEPADAVAPFQAASEAQEEEE